MKMIRVYETGDRIRFKEGWRDWDKGEEAVIKAVEFDKGVLGEQALHLISERSHDFHVAQSDMVELVAPEEEMVLRAPNYTTEELQKFKESFAKLKVENTNLTKLLKAVRYDPWQEKGAGVYYFASTDDDRTIQQLMTDKEYRAIVEELKTQESSSNVHYGFSNFYERIIRALRRADDDRVNVINQLKLFQEDVLVLLRAIALQVEVFCNSGTHREKDVLASGLIRLIESALQKVNDKRESFVDHWWQRPDVFRSDYPIRRYQERLREKEQEIKQLEAKWSQVESSEPASDLNNEVPL